MKKTSKKLSSYYENHEKIIVQQCRTVDKCPFTNNVNWRGLLVGPLEDVVTTWGAMRRVKGNLKTMKEEGGV